jgi:site-specific DNA recombinase
VNHIKDEKRIHGFVYDRENENLPLKIFTKCDKCGNTMTGYLVKKKGLHYYKCNTKGCGANRNAKVMHEKFRSLLKNFWIEKEDREIIKLQPEEQMGVFFKSQIENVKALRLKLVELKAKQETMEERFVIGEIVRNLYNKFKPKYEKECFEIERELIFSSIPQLARVMGGDKKRDSIKFDKIPLGWCHSESNQGHTDFQSVALPTELWHRL